MFGVLSGLITATAGALIALALNWMVQRRTRAARLREYRDGDLGGWQAWQRGFYDVRDWANSIHGFLRAGAPQRMEFSFIRIPGPRYLDYAIRTDRVPPEYLQQALVLSDYCVLLRDVMAQVIAADVRDPRPLPPPWAVARWMSEETAPVALQLADAVSRLAAELADPELARLKEQRKLARALASPRRQD